MLKLDSRLTRAACSSIHFSGFALDFTCVIHHDWCPVFIGLNFIEMQLRRNGSQSTSSVRIGAVRELNGDFEGDVWR